MKAKCYGLRVVCYDRICGEQLYCTGSIAAFLGRQRDNLFGIALGDHGSLKRY